MTDTALLSEQECSHLNQRICGLKAGGEWTCRGHLDVGLGPCEKLVIGEKN